jgi:phage tail sheath gpL-like
MALTGIDPNDPTPTTRRELIFGAGISAGGGLERKVLFLGNKTAAGSETDEVLGDAISDGDDALARMGARSELYQMFKKYSAVDAGATMHFIAVAESAGNAADADFTFAVNSDATTTVKITVIGEQSEVAIADGDTPTTVATAVAAAINSMVEGSLPVTASSLAGVVTVSAANVGPRGDLIIGNAADRGVRMSMTKATAMTIAKGALTGGTVADDFAAALTAADAGVFYYQASSKHATTTVTATDGGIGEHIQSIRDAALPINGKESQAAFGLVGTQAQATAVSISAAANSVRASFFHTEDNDWTPGMLSAHHLAVMRSQQIKHPSENLAGYSQTDTTTYLVPDPFVKNDRPTASEIKADLNNGISPIGFDENGRASLIRHITSRSLNSSGANDYRAREGHITSAIDFSWQVIKTRWDEQKQPFLAANPAEGKKPTPRTTTPAQVRAIIESVIDDLTAATPLGTYNGPILAPDKIASMKSSIVVSLIPAGVSCTADLVAVQHNLKGEFTIRETGAAY